MRMQNRNNPYTPLNFSEIERSARRLANIIETRLEELTGVLLRYESYEVVQDEVARTLDLLKNIKENKKYFQLRIGAVTTFLPRNQPLYAFACFVVVPSLMASEVHFRIPHSMKGFFSEMLELLEISKLFPNIVVSTEERLVFLKKNTSLLVNPMTNESKPVTDVVIFTGIPNHADRLRLIFDKRTLFIANGAGHNPVIISRDAKLSKAVEAVLALQFYNQGQDCAAPNAILLHKAISAAFLGILREKIKAVKISPINDPEDLARIQEFLIDNRRWLDQFTPGIIRTRESIVEPTIIYKPLVNGGNYREIFAPIIYIQEYSSDKELKLYFENREYVQNAMYVTLYGNSLYVKKLLTKKIIGKIWHDKSTFIHNTHLHAPGIERGTKIYGGFGYEASSLSINGKTTAMPTLPQRDIYRLVALPILRKKSLKTYRTGILRYTETQEKNIEKLLKIQSSSKISASDCEKKTGVTYLDLNLVKKSGSRYIKIEGKEIFQLLKKPNIAYIRHLKDKDILLIHRLKELLKHKSTMGISEFSSQLYSIPKKLNVSKEDNLARQRLFFQNIYQLLFGQRSGPRLALFLLDAENKNVERLLDV